MARFRKSSATRHEFHDGHHRFEHWYRDNTVYFITARCRDKFAAFESEEAKAVFWDRFAHWAAAFGFIPWVTTLLHNHYHTLGYPKIGENLGPFMRRLHGSVAKLVNDLLPERRVPFWRTTGNRDYFAGVSATSSRRGGRTGTPPCKRFARGSSAITASTLTPALGSTCIGQSLVRCNLMRSLRTSRTPAMTGVG